MQRLHSLCNADSFVSAVFWVRLGALSSGCELQTLERSYLLKVNGTVVERPQHMLMRVAVSVCSIVLQQDAVYVGC